MDEIRDREDEMNYSLNSKKGGYVGDSIGELYRGY